mmetsp:Transcript_45273/g.88925  ORF Transcript_45273/g.88925 Transcript_45273/m.88925 type:complete len:612 (+) Transcript_45273:279-2114(+)
MAHLKLPMPKTSMRLSSFLSNNKSLKKHGSHTFFSPESVHTVPRNTTCCCTNGRGGLSCFIVYPDGMFRLVWDLLILSVLLYTAFAVPYMLCFSSEIGSISLPVQIVESVVDTFFIADIIIHFRCAYYSIDQEDLCLYDDTARMALHYLKGWFLIDFVSIGIPYGLDFDPSLRAVTLLKILRILKGFRALDRLKLAISPTLAHIFRIFKLIIALVWISHTSACIFFWIGQTEENRLGFSWLSHTTMFLKQNSLNHKYAVSLYWAVVTILTTGYGDVTPQTSNEIVFCLFVLLLGSVCYAFIFGNVTIILQGLDQQRQRYLYQERAISEFQRLFHMPHDLRNRILNHTEYTWDLTSGFNPHTVLDELPEGLRTDVLMSMHRGLIDKVPFFQTMGASDSLRRAVVSKLRPLWVMENEVIFREGDPANAMYILEKGICQVENKNGVAIAQLSGGSFFGEIGLMEKCLRTATIKSSTKCHLHQLRKFDFESILHYFPEFRDGMQFKAGQRLERDYTRAEKMGESIPRLSRSFSGHASLFSVGAVDGTNSAGKGHSHHHHSKHHSNHHHHHPHHNHHPHLHHTASYHGSTKHSPTHPQNGHAATAAAAAAVADKAR